MRKVVLGQPLSENDLIPWIKRSLKEIERTSADSISSVGTTLFGTGDAPTWASYAVKVANVNMNSVADTKFTFTLPSGFTRYQFVGVSISKASTSLAAATAVVFQVFTASGGGGIAVTGATTATVSSTAENTNNNFQFTAGTNTNTQSFNANPLYFRVTTAHGSAATADVTMFIRFIP
jgi:hypothetical protein